MKSIRPFGTGSPLYLTVPETGNRWGSPVSSPQPRMITRPNPPSTPANLERNACTAVMYLLSLISKPYIVNSFPRRRHIVGRSISRTCLKEHGGHLGERYFSEVAVIIA